MKPVLCIIIVLSFGSMLSAQAKAVSDTELFRFMSDAPTIADTLLSLGMNFSGVESGGKEDADFSPEPGWWLGLRANPASQRVLLAKSWSQRFWDIVHSLRIALYIQSLRNAYDQSGEESLKTKADALSQYISPEDLALVARFKDRLSSGLPFIDW